MSSYEIRALKTLDEMYEAADLQRVYWGDDVESIVPAHMLFTLASYGGHVLAAFDKGRMIAVLIGLIGTDTSADSDRPAMANLLIGSKRMVVLPEYRGGGIGYDLKLEQRRIAMKQGIRLVTWTFDPLLSLNAHLNLRKLGCVSQHYYINLYGTSDRGGLSTMGWSDRLRVDWWVTNRRVEERLNGKRGAITLQQYLEGNGTIVNPAQFIDGDARPNLSLQDARGAFALVEIPLNYPQILKHDPQLAKQWQEHIRPIFTKLMDNGYIVTDFLRESYEGRDRGFYLMSFNMGFDFSLN